MKYSLHLCLLLLVFFSSPAQKGGEFFEKSLDYKIPFTTTQYSTKNGLIQNQIVEVKATGEGLLFLSTGNGVYTFNGYDLKEITSDKEYRQHFFRGLAWNEAHQILLGADSQGKLCQLLPNLKDIDKGNADFTCISSAANQVMLGSASGKVYTLDLPAFTLKKLPLRLPGTIQAICINGPQVYIAIPGGLYVYNSITHATHKLSDGFFYRLRINPYSGRVYGLTDSKVYEIRANSLSEKLALNIRDGKSQFTDIAFIAASEFYLSSRKGLYHYAAGKINVFTTDNALASNDMYVLHYNAPQNCLFAGTADKGLMKLQFKNARSLYKGQGLSESSTASIIKTKDNRILFGEICCRMHELLGDTIVTYGKDHGNYSVLTEIDGRLFCGTWGSGVRVFEKDRYIAGIRVPQLPDNTSLAIYKTKKGMIWIGTEKGMSKGRTIQAIQPVFSKEINSQINMIYQLRNGDLCLGGRFGMWIVNDSIIKKKIGKEEGLVSNAVRAFYEDREGKLWIGTYGGGVYCYENDRLTLLNSKKGCMLFEDAFTLAPDGYGNLYMTSNYGLWSVPLKAMNDFYKNKTSFLVPAHYTEENGLLNTEFNGGFQNNYLELTPNHFYFPSIEGLVSFKADTLPFKRLHPQIESVTVNDSLVSTNTSTFARSTFFLKFKVSCISFSARNNVFFQYKLSQQSNEWSAPQKENIFNFYLLTPGHYQLAIRAIDAFNDNQPAEAIYEFTIEAYFYETLWFKILAAILVIAALIGIAVNRVRSHQKKAGEKEFYARRLAEIELKAVQAQLNPHFIFNCLNTIKYFILDHDFEKANKGLNHFSKLLRDVLDNSEKFTISLEHEIKFMTDYLQLEKMRLQEQLEVTITSTVKEDRIFLPAMLIQPHVENAIKHGISNLENRIGILNISFTQHGDVIACKITDNGIGREAASKINKLPTHKSVGISLTKDKSEILKKIHNIEIETTVTDLYATNGDAAGTEVIIKIPIQHESSDH